MLATSQKNKNKTTTSRENKAQVETSSVRTARFVGDSHGCMSCTTVALLLQKWSLKQPYNLTNIVVFFVLTLAGSMVWTLCMIPFRRSPKKTMFQKRKTLIIAYAAAITSSRRSSSTTELARSRRLHPARELNAPLLSTNFKTS